MTVSTVAAEREISREAASFARWASVLEPAAMLAERIAGTQFVPASIRDNAPAILACIMYGDEIGIGPMQSLAGINVIDGRPAPSSELLRALVFAAGHSLRVVALSGKSCTLAGRRRGESEWTEIVWTDEMARNAGLFNKATWNRYPRAMLLARASSELARIMFPDVVKGLAHIADDAQSAEDFESWAVQIADDEPAQPATRTIERRRRAGSNAAAAPSQGDAPVAGLRSGITPAGPATAAAQDGAPVDGLAPSGAPGGPSTGHLPPPDGASETPGAPSRVPPQGTGQGDAQPREDDEHGGPLPDADDAQPDAPVNARLIKAIMAGFNAIHCDNRALRLAISCAVIGRHITTSMQLSRREALQLIGALSDLSVGARTLNINADGSVDIVAREEV